MENIPPYKVIIVGAGLSGLSAANYLSEHSENLDIEILEAKNKAGGRICSRTLFSGDESNKDESSSGVFELGAQWIHGEHGPFFQLIKESGHVHSLTSWEGKGDFLTPNGEKVEDSIVKEIFDWMDMRLDEIENTISIETLYDNPMKWGNDSSMGSYLREEFDMYMHGKLHSEGEKVYEEKVAVFQWIMGFQRIDNSCESMLDLSLFRWSEFEQNPGEHYNNFKTGAQSFVDEILVKKTLEKRKNVCIRYNCPVEKINWNGNGNDEKISVISEAGEVFQCDCILITCSVGLLKATHQKLFNPELPTHITSAIEATGFGPLTKIFLQWEEPWWPKDLKGYQLLWPKEYINCCDEKNYEIIREPSVLAENWPKSITGFDPVLNCQNALLAWLGGPEAVYVESLPDDVIGSKCTEILQTFTKRIVPKPTSVLVSKWNSDKYTRGAYSYRAAEGDRIDNDIATILSEPLVRKDTEGKEWPVVMFAGEALHKSHYSTMHGAYESGLSQAQNLLLYLNTNSTNEATTTPTSENTTNGSSNSNNVTMSLPNSAVIVTAAPSNSITLQKSTTKVC